MTATADGSRWPCGKRMTRPAMWLGHYEAFFLLAAVAVSIADDAFGNPDVLVWLGDAAWAAWLVTVTAELQYHRWQLCERCISRAPALSPQAAVDRWRAALWLSHQRRLLAALLVATVGFIFIAGGGRREQPWQFAVDAIALAVLGGVTVARHEHGRLQPWCPWCHWGDGGDEEMTPVAPEDHGVKV